MKGWKAPERRWLELARDGVSVTLDFCYRRPGPSRGSPPGAPPLGPARDPNAKVLSHPRHCSRQLRRSPRLSLTCPPRLFLPRSRRRSSGGFRTLRDFASVGPVAHGRRWRAELRRLAGSRRLHAPAELRRLVDVRLAWETELARLLPLSRYDAQLMLDARLARAISLHLGRRAYFRRAHRV